MLVGVWREELDKIPRGNMSISDMDMKNLRDQSRLDKTVCLAEHTIFMSL
jgi:hypothetical protein